MPPIVALIAAGFMFGIGYRQKDFISDLYMGVMLKLLNPLPPEIAGQAWLIERMRRLGYETIDINGFCFGISGMSMQAFLADDFDTFKQRVLKLAKTPLSDFESARDTKLAEIQDVHAFFDGIYIGQNAATFTLNKFYDHKQPEKQNFNQTLEYTLPNAEDPHNPLTKNKTPTQVGSLIGSYDRHNLYHFLYSLENSLNENTALILACNRHAINLNYDAEKKSWLLVNPSTLPGAYFTDIKLLEFTLRAYFNFHTPIGTGLVIHTTFFTQACHAETVQNDLQTLSKLTPYARERFNKLHDGSRHNVTYGRYSPLYYAVYSSDKAWILNALKDKSFDINQEVKTALEKEEHKYALTIAIDTNNAEMIQFLVDNGAKLTDDMMKLAIRKHKKEIVEILVKCGFVPNETTLEFAVHHGNKETVELLLSAGIKPTEKAFRLINNAEMIHILLKAGITPTNSLLSQGFLNHQVEVIAYCLHHNIRPTEEDIKKLHSLDVLQLLVKYQINLTQEMLEVALVKGNDDAAFFIMQQDVKPNQEMLDLAIKAFEEMLIYNDYNNTLDNIELRPGYVRCIKMLLDEGIKPSGAVLSHIKHPDVKCVISCLEHQEPGISKETFNAIKVVLTDAKSGNDTQKDSDSQHGFST